MPTLFRQLCHVSFLGAILSCANIAFADNTVSSNDPYQTFNRHAFAMNQTVDKVVYRPVATIYKTALPNVAQTGIHNAFANVGMISTIANDALQLKVYDGAQDFWRFFFNSTIGVLGLFDVAKHMGLPGHSNDFGTTLAKYGFHQSNYFVIPFLGPSTIRDTVGLGMDTFYLSAYPYVPNVSLRNSLLALYFVEERAQLLPFDDLMDQAAIDPYVFQRNAYLQHRDYVVSKNLGEPIENEDTYVSAQ